MVLCPVNVFAGTSDPGGVANVLVGVVVFAFVLWLVFVTVVSWSLVRSNSLRVLISMGLGVAPLAYCGHKNEEVDKNLRDQATENERLAEIADAYLLERCGQDRVSRSVEPVLAAAGLFVDVAQNQKLALGEIVPRAEQTSLMQKNPKWYDESYLKAVHFHQYTAPIAWANQVDASSILRASQFSFVDKLSRLSVSTEQVATARKAWWNATGKNRVAFAEKQELWRRLANLPDGENGFVSMPVTSVNARYVFYVQDVSTKEDRSRWVGRGRMRLAERDSGEVVAEYVGFVANISPAYASGPGSGGAWERAKVCPGAEQKYLRQRGDWDAVEFFFSEVVTYQ
ncbi:MAG: hypothetical protein RIS44_1989 [Pseudomonadota bacterium]|jgi:hypothetical protein